MHLCIMLQGHWIVLFRFDCKRIHEDLFANSITQRVLKSHQVSCDRRADTFTLRVEHIEDHDLIFDEVVVELELTTVLTSQHKIRKVTLSDPLTRRYLFELRRRPNLLGLRQQRDSKRSRSQRCYQTSAFQIRHNDSLLQVLSPGLSRRTQWVAREPHNSGYGCVLWSPTSSICPRNIIAWSSWTTLW